MLSKKSLVEMATAGLLSLAGACIATEEVNPVDNPEQDLIACVAENPDTIEANPPTNDVEECTLQIYKQLIEKLDFENESLEIIEVIPETSISVCFEIEDLENNSCTDNNHAADVSACRIARTWVTAQLAGSEYAENVLGNYSPENIDPIFECGIFGNQLIVQNGKVVWSEVFDGINSSGGLQNHRKCVLGTAWTALSGQVENNTGITTKYVYVHGIYYAMGLCSGIYCQDGIPPAQKGCVQKNPDTGTWEIQSN